MECRRFVDHGLQGREFATRLAAKWASATGTDFPHHADAMRGSNAVQLPAQLVLPLSPPPPMQQLFALQQRHVRLLADQVSHSRHGRAVRQQVHASNAGRDGMEARPLRPRTHITLNLELWPIRCNTRYLKKTNQLASPHPGQSLVLVFQPKIVEDEGLR